MSFYEYCVEIANVPYYNFLTEEEYDALYERYERFLQRGRQGTADDSA